MSGESDDAASATRPRRRLVAAARAKADQVRTKATDARERFTAVDIAVHLWTRDAAVGGAVLSGAVAFRMFLWALPAAVLGVGVLGFNSADARNGATSLGLRQATAQTVEAAAEQAHRSRWLLVIIGLIALVSVSRTLGATLSAAIALTWQLPLRDVARGYVRTAAITAGVAAASIVVLGVCSWLRNLSFVAGLIGAVLAIIIWSAGWWGVSALLPHPPLPWWGLLPGAALFGAGVEIIHVAVIFYLSPKIDSASALYGSLGLASTLLIGAYLIARLMIASAGFSATIYERYLVVDSDSDDVSLRD